MTSYLIGQRWISEAEPELGLGTVLKLGSGTVSVLFQGNGTVRQYSRESAPLKRVQFRTGETIKRHAGESLTITAIAQEKGLTVYLCGEESVPESQLCASLSLSGPSERLLAGRFDPMEAFELRRETRYHQHARRKSPVRGFAGGRIDLIPHQLFIAHEVASRLAPRVLLADEVGLGKTIESCLIVHRLLQSGRAARVLILVPEPLIHQWFVELLRRFNLWFNIYDEERCEAIESPGDETNPFLDDQLALSSVSFLASNERRKRQAVDARWDLLVVDEAHHLNWKPGEPSAEYQLVKDLGGQTPGLILLSATPEQFGLAGHFARLHLLDPDRFYDLETFRTEAADYRQIASLAGKLLEGIKLEESDVNRIVSVLFPNEPSSIRERIKRAEKSPDARDALIADLIDRHGTGRVMFRNTRSAMAGFPKRVPHLAPLADKTNEPELQVRLAREFASDSASHGGLGQIIVSDLSLDPRITWLADLLRKLAGEKVLLICRTAAKVEAIDRAIRTRININCAPFHEQLPLIHRDRNAAWFAESDGATLLLCSEIGSEGRNFQFSHHLVLFDLPSDPDLLEQRIGRLDRIGQTKDIHIHIPFVSDSPQSVLARWYHEGLNAFGENLHGGHELFERFGPRVNDLALDFHETLDHPGMDSLVKETRRIRRELLIQLEKGRDRLLELNSFRPVTARSLVEGISTQDRDSTLQDYLLRVFDQYGIQVEDIDERTFRLGSSGVFADVFPALPAEGLTVTFDRRRALSREDIAFLSWDHPLVTGAMDLLLGTENGNSSLAWWPDPESRTLLIEAFFVLECLAPEFLHVERFLPATPIRIVVDQESRDVSADCPLSAFRNPPNTAFAFRLLDQSDFRQSALPRMIESTGEIARAQAPGVIASAAGEMRTKLESELDRLETLRLVNRNVRQAEIDLAANQIELLDRHLKDARLRLDALRLVWRGSAAWEEQPTSPNSGS